MNRVHFPVSLVRTIENGPIVPQVPWTGFYQLHSCTKCSRVRARCRDKFLSRGREISRGKFDKEFFEKKIYVRQIGQFLWKKMQTSLLLPTISDLSCANVCSANICHDIYSLVPFFVLFTLLRIVQLNRFSMLPIFRKYFFGISRSVSPVL